MKCFNLIELPNNLFCNFVYHNNIIKKNKFEDALITLKLF